MLILDEPSNHLDIEYLDWLTSFLKDINLPFILCSHDRLILDEAVNEIWELKNGVIHKYTGNYEDYKKEKEIRYKNQIENYKKSENKINELKKVIIEKKQGAMRRREL